MKAKKVIKEIKKKKDIIAGKPGDWEIVGETHVYDIHPDEDGYHKPPTKGWFEIKYMELFPEYFIKFKNKWNIRDKHEIISLLQAEEIAFKAKETLSKIIEKIKSDKLITIKGNLSGKEYKLLKIK